MLTDVNDDRPIILAEYLYQIRNSGGRIYHFPELTENHPRFQGGFVWDWQDKCLLQTHQGDKFFAYGGDFGESMTDEEMPKYMTNNGIVLPDLTWKPMAYELKEAYAPVVVRPANERIGWDFNHSIHTWYKILNKSFAHNLGKFNIICILREDGHVVHEEVLNPDDIPPLSETEIEVRPAYTMKEDSEYYIEFRITQKEETFYADAGYETGCSQYLLQGACKAAKPSSVKGSKGELEFSLDQQTGSFNLSKNGKILLQNSGIPCIDRPFTGLDTQRNWGIAELFKDLRGGNTVVKLESIDTMAAGDVRVAYKLLTDRDGTCLESTAEIRYTVLDGVLQADCFFALNENLIYVPRVGLELITPAGFGDLSYYGMGENENYSDRLLSARMGVYKSTVGKQHFPFIPPSECGGHEQVRWLILSHEQGHGIKITGNRPFHFDAHHNTVEDYQQATHDHKLPKREETWLHIDVAHSGIGSDMAWSTYLAHEHMVSAGAYHLRFSIMPL